MALSRIPVKKNSTADDAVKLIIETAWNFRNSQAVDVLLKELPLVKSVGWFARMFWLIDAMTAYRFDDPGREQIKTPDRFLLKDRFGDCDDYTTLWLSILYRVGITAYPKIVDYQGNGVFDHVYCVVPLRTPYQGKSWLILDNVYGKFRREFNREVEYVTMKVFKDEKRNFYEVKFK